MRKLAIATVLVCTTISIGAGTVTMTSPDKSKPQPDAPARVTVEGVLAMKTPDELLPLANAKLAALSLLLGEAVDGESARRVRPDVERCYVEAQLLGIRVAMLPPPTAEDRARVAHLAEAFERARKDVHRQCERIVQSAAIDRELNAVVGPLYTEVKEFAAAKARSLDSQLQTVRSQIELYKLQHDDRIPDFRHKGWQQLTHATTRDGAVDPAGKFGPYLTASPQNPLSRGTGIVLIQGNPKPGASFVRPNCGYVIDEGTGRIWALDSEGRIVPESGATADVR